MSSPKKKSQNLHTPRQHDMTTPPFFFKKSRSKFYTNYWCFRLTKQKYYLIMRVKEIPSCATSEAQSSSKFSFSCFSLHSTLSLHNVIQHTQYLCTVEQGNSWKNKFLVLPGHHIPNHGNIWVLPHFPLGLSCEWNQLFPNAKRRLWSNYSEENAQDVSCSTIVIPLMWILSRSVASEVLQAGGGTANGLMVV